MATFGQVKMLATMCAERGLPDQPVLDEQNAGTLDNKRVQQLFKILKAKPKLQKVAAATESAPTQVEKSDAEWKTAYAEREAAQEAAAYLSKPDFFGPMALTKKNVAAAEGGYVVDGQIYKVKKGSSGYNYALKLAGKTAKGKPEWEIAKGFVFKLTEADRMTKAQVKAFGDLYHHCIFCGLELTRPESVDRGCGPVCAEKYGVC